MGDDRINLKVVQKYDQFCAEILDKTGRTALYVFHPENSEWSKTKTEGVLFFYKRSLVPFYAFMILNIKTSSANQIEFITKDLQLQLQLPFLLYKNQQGNIHSVWFYNEEDCSRIAATIGKYVRDAGGSSLKIGARKLPPSDNTPTSEFPESQFQLAAKGDLQSNNQLEFGSSNTASTGVLDLITMLTKAKQEFHAKPSGDQIKLSYSSTNKPNNSRSIDLKDLFASSNSNQMMTASPSSNSNKNATIMVQGTPTPTPATNQSRNFPQPAARSGTTAASGVKDASHDGGGMTLEQLERMLVSQNSDCFSQECFPNVIASPSGSPRQDEDEDDNEILTPSMLPSKSEKELVESSENKEQRAATSNSIASSSLSGHLISDVHSTLETMATQPHSHKKNKSKTVTDGLHLTKEQLKESLVFLLQEDDSFLNKIHSAYLQTLEKRLNHQ